ncbi:MFS transporter [Gluconobacter kondonii]|uniref:MFS transporter n=1 Tax=Gluconobacter kondonii TaxID=941463 RepID=UPI001980CA49|nr:MFS transporter [Gluconobacter kondonii]
MSLTENNTKEKYDISKNSFIIRYAAIAGVVIVAFNLRAAVAALSPIYSFINHSFPVTARAQGTIGMLPTLSFAACGLVTPKISQRIGLVTTIILGMTMIIAGSLGRAYLSHSSYGLGLFSIITFCGMGIGNVLIPPCIKHYFPNSIGKMTALYNVLAAIGAALPSFCAVIVAEHFGWRFSVGLWGMLAIFSIVPWFALLQSEHHQGVSVPHQHNYQPWKWLPAWGTMGVFAGGAAAMYAFIAWLPTILINTAGVSAEAAGVMLAVYSLVGLVHNAIVPNLIVKMKNNVVVILFAAACIIVGSLGLAYYPKLSWIWIIPAGLGAMNITIGLTLINIRSNTEEGTVALSGFMQSLGYLIGSVGPWLVGELYNLNKDWIFPLWFIAFIGIIIAICGFFATKGGVIEDAQLKTEI